LDLEREERARVDQDPDPYGRALAGVGADDAVDRWAGESDVK
jgi:hypothetical protein